MLATKEANIEQAESSLRQLIDLPAIAEHFQVTQNAVRGWVNRNEFPKPHRIGRRLLRWEVETINAWIDAGCPKVD